MAVRYGMIALLLLVLILATAEAQEASEPIWRVNIILPDGTTVDHLRETTPGIRVLELQQGSCQAEVSLQEIQMLRDAGACMEILRAPGRPRSTLTLPGNVIAGSASPFVQEMVDAVTRDSLIAYVSALQAFGTRYEYTPQRDSAAAYILRTLNGFGTATQSDWYVFGTTTVYDLETVSHDSIWITGTNSMLVATTDAGLTWHAQTSPVSTTYYGLDFRNRFVGWAVGSGGAIIHTTDAGASWAQQTTPTTATLYDVGFASERHGIAVGSGGVALRTTDGGTTWTPTNSGTNARLRRLETIDTLNAWAVGDSGKIIHSTDGGASWVAQVSGTTGQLYGVDFITADIGWAVGQGPFVLKTTDGGVSWWPMNPPAGSGTVWTSVSFQDPLHGWATSISGIISSSINGGQSWSTTYNHLNLGWGPSIYTIKANAGGQILCCGSRGTLSASQDGGVTWNSQTANLPPQYLRQSRNIIASIPGRMFPERECIIVAHYDSYSDDPYVSAPGANDNASGTSAVMEAARVCRMYAFQSTVKLIAVSAEEFGMYGSANYALAARDRGRAIVGAVNGDMIGYPIAGDTSRLVIGSYVTRNRLIDSALAYNARYGIGLTLVPIVDLTGASDYGPFALAGYDALDVAEGTPDEIWGGADPYYHKTTDTMDKLSFGMIRRGAQLMLATLAELAVPVERLSSTPPLAEIPDRFTLDQNYPNPFNPRTAIRYQVPVAVEVRLVVCDLLGREVAVLAHEQKAAGSYTALFDAGGLASGVYLCRLQAGSFIQTMKMVLLR